MSVILNGSSQYLDTTTKPAGTPPFTLSIFFKSTDVTASQMLASLEDSSTKFHVLQAAGAVASDPVRAMTYETAWAIAATTAGYATGQWHHACGVWAADNDRRVYLDGANKGTDTTNKILSGLSRFMVGVYKNSARSGYFSGRLAYLAAWNVALNDAEVALLAAGVSPQNVRPESLVDFWPLVTDANNVIRTNTLTAYGAPGYDGADNPTVNVPMYWRRLLTEYMPSVTPTLSSVKGNSLTASRLAATDADKKVVSVPDLSAWIGGTTNRVTVTSDGDGTVTLSGPQDLHTGASPTFDGLTISSGTATGHVIHAQGIEINGASSAATMCHNAYENSGWKYRAAGYANLIQMDATGCIVLYNAGSGSANGAITWSQVFTILNNGKIGVGTITNPQENIHANDTIRADTCFNVNGTDGKTEDVAVAKVGGGTRTLHFSGGLYTGYTDTP